VNFLIENWLLILLALSSGAMLLLPSLTGVGAGKVSAAEAVRLINREKGVLIDVGEPAEYAAGHAIGAKSVPFDNMKRSLEGNKALPSNKATPVILTCPTGARAARAASLLRKQGYDKAVSLAGGNRAWGEASLPVEKAA
jgi:rhodanese-related sulfurtransferase